MSRAETVVKYLVEHAPAIFTGLAAVGTVTTTALAIKATPKALDKLDNAYLDKGEPLNKKEVVKATWKCYIPAAVSGGMTIGFIFAANYAHIRKETAMAAMASFFEKRYLDYQNKVIECTDEETDKAIRTSIAEDEMAKNPPKHKKLKAGEFMCYEPNTKQYFTTTENQLLWAKLTANKILSMEEKVYLNQILALFPNADHKKKIGDKIGWYMDDSYYEFVGYNWGYYGRPWLDIDYEFSDKNGQNVAILDFSIAPVHEEAYDVEAMMEYAQKVEEELFPKHIKEEVEEEKKKSQEKH